DMNGPDNHQSQGRVEDVDKFIVMQARLIKAESLFKNIAERIVGTLLLAHHALRAGFNLRDYGDSLARLLCIQQGIQKFAFHGPSGSTNTRILPPQARPTCQAVSSATPKANTFDLPVAMASSAS